VRDRPLRESVAAGTRILQAVYNALGNLDNGEGFFNLFGRSLKFANQLARL
jgi:hypothetical protein